jgi:hypothetical protein
MSNSKLSREKSSHLTLTPRSAAAIIQGVTLPSWSMRDSTISSPSAQSRARLRDIAKVRPVML